MDLVELSRRIENLVRVGTVHAVDHARVRCRVQSGGLVTQWLRWHTPRAGKTRTWDPPTVGEQAIVLSPSGEPGNGVVFYGFNADAIQPPSHSPNDHVIEYPDGGRIRYDHETSEYQITVPARGRIALTIGATELELRNDGTTLRTPKFEGVQS